MFDATEPVLAPSAGGKTRKRDKKMAKTRIENGQFEPVGPKKELVGPKKKANKLKPTQLGSARGIESMFRNSYRAQLDMIALAATKANIMISLNGLLVSVLLVSGSYFLSSQPMLIVPFTAFLLTCTVAIVFAVLAARPTADRTVRSLEDFRSDSADLLIFEQFAKLPQEDYVDAMLEMLRDNDRVYRNMVVHIHNLGLAANRKFARLYISYGTFMVGLVISVTLLLVVIGRSAMTGV